MPNMRPPSIAQPVSCQPLTLVSTCGSSRKAGMVMANTQSADFPMLASMKPVPEWVSSATPRTVHTLARCAAKPSTPARMQDRINVSMRSIHPDQDITDRLALLDGLMRLEDVG